MANNWLATQGKLYRFSDFLKQVWIGKSFIKHHRCTRKRREIRRQSRYGNKSQTRPGRNPWEFRKSAE